MLYYAVPVRFRSAVLLLAGISYYLLSGNGLLIIFPIMAAIISWAGAYAVSFFKKKKAALTFTVVLLLAPLVAFKYVNFLINTINAMTGTGSVLPNIGWIAPLGISFYTFSALSYVIDVYNKAADFQKNFWKVLSYVFFFPAILSGPIFRYRYDAQEIGEGHPLDYKNITFGAQRMLWGFFKTLVISERLRIFADCVFNEPGSVGGWCAVAGAFCYAFELYTNFSGCMDIVIGMSNMLGIVIPENFNTPFFSKNIQEFWRRWHITLGVWMKEYVFYPVLMTRWYVKLNDKCKARFGNKKGKQYANILPLLILWFTVGVWHGGDWKYVIGSGLLHWFYIVSGQLLAPVFDRIMNFLKIPKGAKLFDVFRIVRTFVLVCIGFVFFRAYSVKDAFWIFKSIFTVKTTAADFLMKLEGSGLDVLEICVLSVSMILLFVVSLLQQKGSVREMIDKKSLPLRWIIWFALLFFTIMTGFYGPGYSSAEFIYQGF